MKLISNYVRAKGDPKVLQKGPSSLVAADRLGRTLGLLGMGLGMFELFAARRITKSLGLRGFESVVRIFGAREVLSGMMTLSTERKVGLWSRVGGDVLDIGALFAALGAYNGKRTNIGIALSAVLGITLLDLVAAERAIRLHAYPAKPTRSYRNRSGFPNGIEAARGSVTRRETEKTPQADAAE